MGNKNNRQKEIKIGNVTFQKGAQLESVDNWAVQEFSKSKWWLCSSYINLDNRYQN
jgi:hypothetical protein